MAGMSLIHWLNQHPVFIKEVTFQVQEEMAGRPIEPSSEESGLTGEVIAFKLILPLQLDFAGCVGLTCAIPFKAVGVATGRCPSPSGGEITFRKENPARGFGSKPETLPGASHSISITMRAIWKGSISFGLVNIPISLFPATRSEDLKFRLLRNGDLSPVNYKRVAERGRPQAGVRSGGKVLKERTEEGN